MDEKLVDQKYNYLQSNFHYKELYELENDHKRARQSEQNLKAQILELFEYLVTNFSKDMFNENANGACKTAVKIMEKQSLNLDLVLELLDEFKKLFQKETDILNLEIKKLTDLVKLMQTNSPQ